MPGKKFHGYIDAHTPAPLAARPDMWANLSRARRATATAFHPEGPGRNDIGYSPICTPAANLKMY